MTKSSQVTLKIEGMHCASCVSGITSGLGRVAGVLNSEINLALNNATVTFDPGETSLQEITNAIAQLGYKATAGQADVISDNAAELTEIVHRFTFAAMLAGVVMVIAMWPAVFSVDSMISPFLDGLFQLVVAGIILFYAGRSIIQDAWQQAKHFRANMHTLIALGTLTAYLWSLYQVAASLSGGVVAELYFDSAGMIITLVLLGRFLEAKAKGRAGQAVEALLKLRPSTCTAIIDNYETEIEIADVKTSMILLVKAGELIPADGVVSEGRPVVDESILTGESAPVEKDIDDQVIGGALNGTVPFKMEVTAAGNKSFLAGVIRLVTEAQQKQAPVQRIADKVAGIFVPVVLLLAVITFAAWYWLAPDHPMLIKSVVSVLIIACPCALGLATPTAILTGTGRAAHEGIIIRGGDVLENLTKIDTVIFDKTGTLTHGELAVVDVQSFGDVSEEELLSVVGSVEKQSEHPLGRAIVQRMKADDINAVTITDVEVAPGAGLRATYKGQELRIGSRSYLESIGVTMGDVLEYGNKQMDMGRTIVFAAIDNEVIGIIALADRIRSEAKDVVSSLNGQITRVALLSGDNRKTAASVANSVGVDEFEADVRPEQKKTIVDSWRKAGYKVAMIGDGINDAPALAAADVGVAIGSGTDVAIESGDIILVHSDLKGVLKMFKVARETMKVIKQNLFWAFFYNIVAIPVAAGLFYPLLGISLSPMIAAAAMSFSSLFVVTNSLKLNKLQLRD